MKRIFAIVLIGLFLVSCTSIGIGAYSKENSEGRQVSIEWEVVNVRQGYSTSDPIITSIPHGTQVTLTGRYYDYLGGEDLATESWVEIQLENGTIGWVVRCSIAW